MDIDVKLFANTDELRRRGLSLIPNLPENGAAVFVYPELVNYPYWNKGVKYPIDIGFFNENKECVYHTSMDIEQLTPVYCPLKYKYVVEMNLGKLDNKTLHTLESWFLDKY